MIKPQRHTPVFSHGPGMGDVIYSLPAVRAFGAGHMLLYTTHAPHYRHYEGRMLSLLPLLNRLPYIRSARFVGCARPAVDYEMDGFYWNLQRHKRNPRYTIVHAHFDFCGLPLYEGWDSPWLTGSALSDGPPVVVNRTSRYRGHADYTFLQDIRGVRIVGCPREGQDLLYTGGIYQATHEFEGLVDVINNCRVFVGNQSSPLAVAAGLGKTRMLEQSHRYPDCTFGHDNEVILTPNPEINRQNLLRLLDDPACDARRVSVLPFL